jgi:hypothetical protein
MGQAIWTTQCLLEVSAQTFCPDAFIRSPKCPESFVAARLRSFELRRSYFTSSDRTLPGGFFD